MFELAVLIVWFILGIETLLVLYATNIVQDSHNEWPLFKREIDVFIVTVWPVFLIVLTSSVIYGVLKNYKSIKESIRVILKYKIQEFRDNYANRF